MKNATLKFIWLLLLLPGCSTVAHYESKLADGPARPADYPIYMYPEGMEVPRPHEIIGIMRVSDTPFTVMGGSIEDVLKKVCDNARLKGADAVKITDIKSPGFSNPHFGAEANVLRFTDPWESVPVPEEEIQAYFRTNAEALDPIEGIWSGSDTAQSRVVILKNHARPRRDFAAFILATENPTWHRGDMKMDLYRGERPGVYRGKYYLDNYRNTNLAFTLRDPTVNQFVIQISDDDKPVIFVRQRLADNPAR